MNDGALMQAGGKGWPRQLATAAGLFAVLGGVLTLVGWGWDIPRLTDWMNDGISMFPNTAVCAALGGAAMLMVNLPVGRWRILARVLGGVLAAAGGATLLEHMTGLNLGIDTLLSKQAWGQVAAAAPMRMGPPASLSFLLIGLALWMMHGSRGWRRVSAVLGVLVSAISMVSIVGYLYGAKEMYQVPRLTGIAMQSASMLFLLGIGIVASLPDQEPMRAILERGAAGLLARRTLPVLLVLSLSLGWARMLIERQGWMRSEFGTALRTVVEFALLTGLLWWAVKMVRAHEKALHNTEGEVRRQARQLSAFLETAAICLHRVGPDGSILWANEAELETLGYSREEYIGQNIAKFYEDAGVIADILSRLHAGEKIVDFEARMCCRNGSVITVLVDSNVFWDEGRFVHSQCFTRDVTKWRTAEAAMLLAKESAEVANIAKDNFVATLSHELRTPLTPVLAALGLWESSPQFPAEFQADLRMVRRNIDLEARLIDDLLDLTRIVKGKVSLNLEVLDVHQVMESVMQMYRRDVEGKGLSLSMTLEAKAHFVRADSGRLQQVIWNLVRNAAKFTRAGGRIEVGARDDGPGRVRIFVKDTGIGISAEAIPRLFRPFEQGSDEVAKRYGGLGLGLMIAQRLVAAQGGEILAESAGLDQGATFTILLPAMEERPAEMAAVLERETGEAAELRQFRLLLVEDHVDTARVLSRVLRDNGHEVKVAHTKREALKQVAGEVFDLMVSDIGLPDGSGVELMREIREGLGLSLAGIALSGYGMEDDIARCKAAGFEEHLTKPINLQKLEATVQRIGGRVAGEAARAGWWLREVGGYGSRPGSAAEHWRDANATRWIAGRRPTQG